jgi:hypothetical protein
MVKLFSKRCSAFVVLLVPVLLGAQIKAPGNPSMAPTKFVEEFYRWYTPLTQKNNTTTTWDIAIKMKGKIFSDQLARLLNQDSIAKAACRELVGLDFDPFLNTQDPSEHYEVGSATRTGRTYRVDIYRVEDGQRAKKPDLTAEIIQKNDSWNFLNFYYSNGSNLLTILRSPQEKCSDPRIR